MNIKHLKRSKNNHKRNVRTYLRGLQFDAFLSQDFLIKKDPTDSDGLSDLLETLKNFCQDINGIAKSLISSKSEFSRKHEDVPKSVLSEFSNNVFVPVYKIFSLDPEEDNEMSVKGMLKELLLIFVYLVIIVQVCITEFSVNLTHLCIVISIYQL